MNIVIAKNNEKNNVCGPWGKPGKKYDELRWEYREINIQKDEGRKIRGKVEGQGENESASTANITRERINGESKIIK